MVRKSEMWVNLGLFEERRAEEILAIFRESFPGARIELLPQPSGTLAEAAYQMFFDLESCLRFVVEPVVEEDRKIHGASNFDALLEHAQASLKEFRAAQLRSSTGESRKVQ